MSDFFGKLKSGAGKVAFEAEKMARLNKAQGELNQIKRQIDTNYTKLGEMYYRSVVAQEAMSPAAEDLCRQIVELERQLALKNEEVAHINAEQFGAPAPAAAAPPAQAAPLPPADPTPAPAPAPSGTKFCSNCGKEIPAAVKFCPDCGSKV